MSDVDVEFSELFEQLDAEDRSAIGLITYALHRGDLKMAASLENYSRRPRSGAGAECEVDFDLVARIKAVCPEHEAHAWGRSLVHCLDRGDASKAALLQDIMRRRTAV